VLREFNDKNNIAFRRDILNQRTDIIKLSKAKGEDLRCEKTKEEEKNRLEQLVRESMKDSKPEPKP
jgi:hypothetical protein